MECDRIGFSRHALQRMFERGVTPAEVHAALLAGDVIEEYSDDKPWPSTLLLAVVDDRPLHLLVAKDPATQHCQVVTVYEPNPAEWSSDLRSRRRREVRDL